MQNQFKSLLLANMPTVATSALAECDMDSGWELDLETGEVSFAVRTPEICEVM